MLQLLISISKEKISNDKHLQVLTGGKAVDDSSRYAVGIISNNKLHLTQVYTM